MEFAAAHFRRFLAFGESNAADDDFIKTVAEFGHSMAVLVAGVTAGRAHASGRSPDEPGPRPIHKDRPRPRHRQNAPDNQVG